MAGQDNTALRKQAWDYFSTHASQRMIAFNFYIVLSSVTATSYFSSFKSDSNLQSARPVLAALLCLFAFIFWKLDQRTKALIKNAERALKFFEGAEMVDAVAKVFTKEEADTLAKKKELAGWRVILFWRWQLSYSDCFNFVFILFFILGLGGLGLVVFPGLGSALMRHLP